MASHLNLIKVDSTPSTNSLLASMAGDAPDGTAILAREQTAGRGQRGNYWEAEPGKNITMSILLKPVHIPPKHMHLISEVVSLAIVRELCNYITPSIGEVAIKWPNDIYVDDKKICGILVENSLMGDYIAHSIVGIGLNVNQQKFYSEAPNPVSISMLTRQEISVDTLAEKLLKGIIADMSRNACEPEAMQSVQKDYQCTLWRRCGYHSYVTPDGRCFKARIVGVEPTGVLILEEENGEQKAYAFKEVSAVLD